MLDWKKEDLEVKDRRDKEEQAKQRRKVEAEKRVDERNSALLRRQTTLRNLNSPSLANLTSNKSSDTSSAEEDQKKAGEEDQKVWYKLYGEAYIHGMMDGETIRERIMKGFPERLFEIR